MVDLGTVVEIGVLVLLPQLAGLLATRLVRHASWTASSESYAACWRAACDGDAPA